MAGYLIGGRFLTGEITLRQVVPLSCGIELALNQAETIDVGLRLPMVDPATGVPIDIPNQLLPIRDFIGWVENGVVIAAGQIQGDPFTFPGSSELKASGAWEYYRSRFVLPPLGLGQLPREVTSAWSGVSLRTIAKRLVQQANDHASAGIPVDFEDDILGIHVREYPGSDGMRVAEALTNLTAVEGGPDITFRPRYGDDRRHVRWDLLTGDPQLTQGGADHYWDVSAPGPNAAVESLDRDGRDLASRAFLTGATVRNLLTNPSFEDGAEGWSAGGNAHSVGVGAVSPFHGVARIAWTAGAAGWSYLDHARAVAVDEGSPVTFSAYMRTGNAVGGALLMRFFDEADTLLSEHMSPERPTTTSTWTRMQVTADAPDGTRSVNVYIGANATAGGQVMGADAAMLVTTAGVLPFTPDELQLQARADNAALLDAGFPLMESWENRSSVLRPATLQAYADEAVVRYSAYTEQFTIRVKRDQHPKLGTYWPGDWASIRIGKNTPGMDPAVENPRIPAGTYRVRIIRISFAAEGDVTLQCAPERVAGGYPVPASEGSWLGDQLRSLSSRVDEQGRG